MQFFSSKLFSRSILRDALIIASLILCRPSVLWMSIGTGLFLLALAFRLWAKGALKRNQVLTTQGAYSICRHPFYLANLLLDYSICVMAGRPLLGLLYIPLFLIVYLPTIRREEDFLMRKFGYAYARFRTTTSLLFPRISLKGAEYKTPWSLRTLFAEREVSRTFRLLAIPFLVLYAGEVKNGWWEALEAETILFLAAALLLHLLGRIIYVTVEKKQAGEAPLRPWFASALLVSILVFCLFAEIDLSDQSELREQARRFHAVAADSASDLCRESKESPKALYIVPDDVLESENQALSRKYAVVRTVWFDFEVYHLLRLKEKSI